MDNRSFMNGTLFVLEYIQKLRDEGRSDKEIVDAITGLIPNTKIVLQSSNIDSTIEMFAGKGRLQ